MIVGAGAPVAGPLLAFAVIAGIPRAADALGETGISADAANGVVTAAALVACLWLRPHVVARMRRARARARRVPPGPADPAAHAERRPGSLTARGLTDPLGILHGIDLELASGRDPRADRSERQRQDDALGARGRAAPGRP